MLFRSRADSIFQKPFVNLKKNQLPASSERPNHHFTAPLRVEEIMDDSSGVEVKSRTAQVALSFSPNTVVALDRFSVDGILLTEYEP